jgi:hypothetical protein
VTYANPLPAPKLAICDGSITLDGEALPFRSDDE